MTVYQNTSPNLPNYSPNGQPPIPPAPPSNQSLNQNGSTNGGAIIPNNQPSTPSPVVNSLPAAGQAGQAQQVVNNPPETPDQILHRILGADYGKTPTQYNNPTTPPATPPPTPPSNPAEDAITHPGQSQYYSTTNGQQEWLPTPQDNSTPSGYSKAPPQTNPTTDTFSSEDGSNYMQFTDGTYGKFNPTTNSFQAINAGAFAAQKQIYKDTKALNDLKNNGTLSPSQQSQIDAITAQYTALIKQQQTANDNATGTQSLAQNLYGMGNTLSGQGEITQVINDGIQKISKLQADEASAIAKMKQGFLADDVNSVREGWNVYLASQAETQKQLDKLQAATVAAKARQEKLADDNALVLNNKYSDLSGENIITANDTQQQINNKLKTSTIWQNTQLKNSALTQSAVAKANSNELNLSDSEISTMAQQVEQMGVSVLAGYGRGDSPNRRAIMKQVADDITSGKSNPLGLNAIELKFASNVNTQNVLKYLGSLTGQNGHKGNLDELVDASNSIDRTQFKPFNHAEYLLLENSGDPNISRFATAAVEVADQVAKVLQGGTGSATSDAKLQQGLSLFNAAKTKEQMISTVNEMKTLLENRKSSLIGDNQFLQEYATHPTVQGAAANGGSNNSTPGTGGGFAESWTQ